MGFLEETDNAEPTLLASREEFERQERLKLLRKAITEKETRPPVIEEDPSIFATAGDAVKQGITGLIQGGIETAKLPFVVTALLFDALDINGTEEQQKETVSYFANIGRIRPEAQTTFGEIVGGVTEFLGPTIGAGSIARKGVEKIVKGSIKRAAGTQAIAFAGGEAILRTPDVATGEISTQEFLVDVGLSGLTGLSLGAVTAIPAKTMTARGARLIGEWAAIAGTAPVVQGRLPSKEEAGYAALLVLGFKATDAGIERLARLRRQPVEDVREEVQKEALQTGIPPSQVLEKFRKEFITPTGEPPERGFVLKTEIPPERALVLRTIDFIEKQINEIDLKEIRKNELKTAVEKVIEDDPALGRRIFGEYILKSKSPSEKGIIELPPGAPFEEPVEGPLKTSLEVALGRAGLTEKEITEAVEHVKTQKAQEVLEPTQTSPPPPSALGMKPQPATTGLAGATPTVEPVKGSGAETLLQAGEGVTISKLAVSTKEEVKKYMAEIAKLKDKKDLKVFEEIGFLDKTQDILSAANLLSRVKSDVRGKQLEKAKLDLAKWPPLKEQFNLYFEAKGEKSLSQKETPAETLERDLQHFRETQGEMDSGTPPSTREEVARARPATEFRTVTPEEKQRLFKEGKAIQAKEADKVLQINFDAIDPLPASEYLGKIQELIKDVDQLRRKQKVSLREQKEIAESLGLKEEDFFAQPPRTALPAEEILVIGNILALSKENLVNTAKEFLAGKVDGTRLQNATSRHITLERLTGGFTGEAGRALRSVREVVEKVLGGAPTDEISQLFGSIEQAKKISPRALAEMISETKTPEELSRVIKQITRPGFIEMITEFRVNGLLSGPTTHVINALSNNTIPFISILERAAAAIVGKGGVVKGEATVMFKELAKFAQETGVSAKESFESSLAYGWHNGFLDMMRLMARSFRSVEPAEGLTKIEDFRVRAMTTENLKHTPIGKKLFSTAKDMGIEEQFARAVDFAGDFIRLPGTLLVRSDELFKALNFRMELHAQAFRQAVVEGLEGGAREARIAELMRDPLPKMVAAAKERSLVNTLTNELGPTGQSIQAFAMSHPLIRWFVLPFVRTPANIAAFALERTPALQFASKSFREDFFGRNGIARQDLAKGKMAFGLMMTGTTGALVAEGAITGSGPSRKEERKLWQDGGNQAYSVWDPIGERWVAYNRLDPVGMAVGLMADLAYMIPQLPEFEIPNILMTLNVAISNNLTSKTYLRGLAEFFEAIQEPRQLPRFMQGQVVSFFVPSISVYAEREVDPTLREARSFMDKLMERIPGLSSSLPPRRNLKGDPIVLDPGLGPLDIFPFYSSTPKDDPVSIEMVKNRMSIGMPQDVIFGTRVPEIPTEEALPGQGIKLSLEEYDEYVRLAGNELKHPATGRGMWDALTKLVSSDFYEKLSPGPQGEKEQEMKRIVTAYRVMAREELLRRHPDLRHKVEMKRVERAGRTGKTSFMSIGAQ